MISLQNIVSKDDDEFDKKPLIKWQSMTKSERLRCVYDAYDTIHKSMKQSVEDKELEKAKYITSFIPNSYRSNTIKEDLVLETVEHFRQQYVHLFPKRNELLLSPVNEVGVHKFISTYVKPTELNFTELYYWDSLARFMSDYITYEPLETFDQLPSVIVSPTTTLHWQKGDSFDLCQLFVSLLVGVGYDAYCVSGRAFKQITTNNQSIRNCPLVIEPEEKPKVEERLEFKPSKYKLKPRPNMKTYYKPEDWEVKDREKPEEKVEVSVEREYSDQEKDMRSPCVHCWILIVPGQRDIREPFFIEPSTGEMMPIESEEYQSVETVWNNENYWVNMMPDLKPSELLFDLNDLQKWEYIFVPDKTEEDLARQREEITALESGEIDDDILDLPASWVGKLKITKVQHEKKYPGNEKKITYKDSSVELYATYHRKDLCVRKITLYDDPSHTRIREYHMFFAHRRDKLTRRSVYRLNMEATLTLSMKPHERVHEWFDPGRRFGNNIEGLKEVIVEKGNKREFRFYHDTRLDRLRCRIELYSPKDISVPYKIIQYFEGREDFLCYRSARYELGGKSNLSAFLNTDTIDIAKKLETMTIVKMTEKFNRNDQKDANHDVARRIFISSENKIQLDYHYGKGKITRSVRRYSDEGDFSTECVDPFMKIPSVVETIEEYNELVDAERECRLMIQKSHEEIQQIMKRRRSEEEKNEHETTIYDHIRNRPTRVELEEMIREEKELEEKKNRRDIIGPFLPIDGIKSVEEAQEVYIKVIEDMQAQLQLRSQILKDRNAKLQSIYMRRKEQHRKSQDVNDTQEDYDQFMEDIGLAIQVCLTRIEDQTVKNVQKWLEVRNEVLNDPRLKMWIPHLQNLTIVNPFEREYGKVSS